MKDIVELLRNAETSVVLDDGKMDLVNHVAADEIERLREALFAIVCNTEPSAIKHRDYDHLANAIYVWASAALGEAK
jgi:hypothetical protein